MRDRRFRAGFVLFALLAPLWWIARHVEVLEWGLALRAGTGQTFGKSQTGRTAV